MNNRLISLVFGISLAGVGAIAMPALADNPYRGNYGAGFLPSPVAYQNYPTIYPTAANVGFTSDPLLAAGSNSPLVLSQTNYGAGFQGSPAVYNQYGAGMGNYGATQSPYLTDPTTVIFTSNYGAGFQGSPTLIQGRSPLRYGSYGAGFMPSPYAVPWFGFGLFRW